MSHETWDTDFKSSMINLALLKLSFLVEHPWHFHLTDEECIIAPSVQVKLAWNCLRIDQQLITLGLGCVMGLEKSSSFFLQPERKKGSAAFLGGIVVLLSGYPFIGMLIEAYGFVALFGGFFPMAISFLRQVSGINLFL